MGRRRDYDKGDEDARRDMVESGSRRGGDFAFTVVSIKYASIVIVMIVISYVVLRIVNAIQGAF